MAKEKDGGRGRDRTGDPLLAKQVLSQLSYTPTIGKCTDFKAFAPLLKLGITTQVSDRKLLNRTA